jgi:hypothetical protein
MSAPAPDPPRRPSQSRILGLTLLADVVGALVIVGVLPLSWSTRVIGLAVYLTLVNVASRAFSRNRAGS